ncbi:MAG: hypothetical protein IJ637_02200 [Prevotella sp.]|nr:hypothetical protein [Prevotella sp.]
MKKLIFTMALLLTLGMGVQAGTQTGKKTAATEQVDSAESEGIEAYSDTTSVDSTAAASRNIHVNVNLDDSSMGSMLKSFFDDTDAETVMGMSFVLLVLLIIFVLAPVLIIIALFYFINKNRKDRLKLAQMAMQQGQPIPEQLLQGAAPVTVEEEYQKGMRQCFVGVGLMVFLGYAAGNVGFGVGALVFCIGLGKVFASRTARKNSDRDLPGNDIIR